MSVAVDLVIPNLDGEALLGACLEAVAAQTLAPARVLVVDSGSVDGSRAIAEALPGDRPLKLVDLGTGRGSNVRYLAVRLPGPQEWLLIDEDPKAIAVDAVPRAEWLLADACEISSLDDAQLYRCNVVIAATGDPLAVVAMALGRLEAGGWLVQSGGWFERSTRPRA